MFKFFLRNRNNSKGITLADCASVSNMFVYDCVLLSQVLQLHTHGKSQGRGTLLDCIHMDWSKEMKILCQISLAGLHSGSVMNISLMAKSELLSSMKDIITSTLVLSLPLVVYKNELGH